jgi:hypothetical protein
MREAGRHKRDLAVVATLELVPLARTLGTVTRCPADGLGPQDA